MQCFPGNSVSIETALLKMPLEWKKKEEKIPTHTKLRTDIETDPWSQLIDAPEGELRELNYRTFMLEVQLKV